MLSVNDFKLCEESRDAPALYVPWNVAQLPETGFLAWELPLSRLVLLLPATDSERSVDESLFMFLVELEVAKAQRLRYCVSVVSLAVDPQAASADLSRLGERIVEQVRSTDIVAPNPESSWTLLLVDAQPQSLPSIVNRLTEQLGPLAWSAGGASYPGTAVDARDLLYRAVELGAQAQEDGSRELYLDDKGGRPSQKE